MNEILSFLGTETTKVGVTVISTVVGIVLTITKIRSALARRRFHLKEDIEIRNSLDKNEKEYGIVSEYVKTRIRNVYGTQLNETSSSRSGTSKTLLGAAVIFSGIYLTYAVHESEDWSAWWYIGTIYLIVLGFFPMFNHDNRESSSADSDVEEQTNKE